MEKVGNSRQRDLALLGALLVAMHLGSVAASIMPESSNCTRSCGNISIPYPFGIEPGCYLATGGFNLTCKNNSLHEGLFLGDGTVQVLEISVPLATVRINSSRVDHDGVTGNGTWGSGLPHGGPFFLSESSPNSVVVIGCNVRLDLRGGKNNDLLGSCTSVCPPSPNPGFDVSPASSPIFPPTLGPPSPNPGFDVSPASSPIFPPTLAPPITSPALAAPITNDESEDSIDAKALAYLTGTSKCGGVGCCQEYVVLGYSLYNIQLHQFNDSVGIPGSYVYIVDGIFNLTDNIYQDWFEMNPPGAFPATLDWVINNSSCPVNGTAPECLSAHSNCIEPYAEGHTGYLCNCSDGYQGNPYVLHGCQDIDECSSPDIHHCYGLCKNTEGSFTCQCPTGYMGNASVLNGCKDINECDDLEKYPCYGTCQNILGSFKCQCPNGTYGNPYTQGGCITIKKSFSGLSIGLVVSGGTSLLLLVLGGPFIVRKIKQQKLKKIKQKFFNQNHGLLLQQLMSQNGDIGERMIITLRDLEKATNNFDKARVIGGGGHGVVFKGILDLHVVAIKKSKIAVQREIDEFINEVAVLSQVNHRNVVRLLGCCLETEVPLLVYEFVSNGTLYDHLHVEGPISLPWDDRIRIAMEVTKAVSYLHSSASIPIFHRDIKSSNILLDDILTAKVSDFGASRYIPIDQTGLITAVQGTIGYLDPMYYYTGRLTDKSDVFSFGVLLVELLTRKKPFVYRSDGGDDGLVSHFVTLLIQGKLYDIIDPQVKEEENGEVEEVAKLAAMCIKLKGEDRPTMREVEMTLENILGKKKDKIPCQVALRNNDEDVTAHYMSIEMVTQELSRQYTMEKEILLSAEYPR